MIGEEREEKEIHIVLSEINRPYRRDYSWSLRKDFNFSNLL